MTIDPYVKHLLLVYLRVRIRVFTLPLMPGEAKDLILAFTKTISDPYIKSNKDPKIHRDHSWTDQAILLRKKKKKVHHQNHEGGLIIPDNR